MKHREIKSMYDAKGSIQLEFESVEYKLVGKNYMLAVKKLKEAVNKLREGGLID